MHGHRLHGAIDIFVGIFLAQRERVVVELNSTGKTWDTQTWAQYVALVPRALPHVPEYARLQIERAILVLGKDTFTTYVVDNTLTAVDSGARVAGYLGRGGNIAFIRRHLLDLDPAAERAYRRWRAMRDRWIASGCPAPPP